MGADGGTLSHWDHEGHWLEHRFEAAHNGEYLLLVKYACPHGARRTVILDKTNLGTFELSNSGGYTNSTRDDYSLAVLRDHANPQHVTLDAGTHVLRFVNADGKGCNLDYIEWIPID